MKRVSIVIFVILFAFASCLGEASLRQTLLSKIQPAGHQQTLITVKCRAFTWSTFSYTWGPEKKSLTFIQDIRVAKYERYLEKRGGVWYFGQEKCTVS